MQKILLIKGFQTFHELNFQGSQAISVKKRTFLLLQNLGPCGTCTFVHVHVPSCGVLSLTTVEIQDLGYVFASPL